MYIRPGEDKGCVIYFNILLIALKLLYKTIL